MSSSHGPISSQYAAAAKVPLIKAPSLWLPKPVELPMDVHPLPDDLSAYFVYPFTLEPHILAQSPPLHDKIRAVRKAQAELLQRRIDEAERKRKEALNRIAPGYNPSSFLVPDAPAKSTSINQLGSSTAQPSTSSGHVPSEPQGKTTEEEFASLRL